MKNENYHRASHCKYLVQYHIIWCPKFRYPILKDGVDETLKKILSEVCDAYGYIELTHSYECGFFFKA